MFSSILRRLAELAAQTIYIQIWGGVYIIITKAYY